MHASPIALVAVAALGCCGTVAAFGLARTSDEASTFATQRAEMASIELVATIPLPGPPTGLAVSRRRVGVSLAVAGVAFVSKDGRRIAQRVRIDGIATSLETDGSRFWVADLLHDRILQLDESGSTLGDVRVGGLPGGIALTESDVWALGLEEPSITLADRWNQLPVVHLTFGQGELWPGAIASGSGICCTCSSVSAKPKSKAKSHLLGGDVGELPAHSPLVGAQPLDRRPREAEHRHVAMVQVDERAVEPVGQAGATGEGAERVLGAEHDVVGEEL